ncbi:MAG: PD-(D/E)XK nuclease family protein [Treponemataceae bacterium]
MVKYSTMDAIKKIIIENIKNPHAIFVFPTQIATDCWADFTLLNTDITAFPALQFMPWDILKRTKFSNQQTLNHPVNAAIRKLFAESLIAENKKSSFLQSLISPKYLDSSSSFVSWLSDILPQLIILDKITFDNQASDFHDYISIKKKYELFLKNFNLFEPSWQNLESKADENTYFIFMPQLIQDFYEYEKKIQGEKNMFLVTVEDYEPQLTIQEYQNSREEIKSLCNQILKLHHENKISFTDIAVNIPDHETFFPYLSRDFSLYGIPFVLQSGKKLGSYQAGNLFTLIQNCISNKFSFDSMKSLLLNEQLAWDENIKQKNKLLVAFGLKNNCICSYKNDSRINSSWNDAFFYRKKSALNVRLKNHFDTIAQILNQFGKATKFSHILDAYFEFRKTFFEKDLLTEQDSKANMILSRCVEELRYLIDLEEMLTSYIPQSPLNFFVQYLNDIQYQPKTEDLGVHIFPYKIAATTPFKYHFVLSCNQNAVNVVVKKYSFLPSEIKDENNLADRNCSTDFLKSYTFSQNQTIFSYAKKTFTQEENPHNFFSKKETGNAEKITYENQFLFPKNSTGLNFKKDLENLFSDTQSPAEKIESLITAKKYKEDKLKISASDLKAYFTCPTKWIFQNILAIPYPETSNELLNSRDIGSFYHMILRLFFEKIKDTKKPLQSATIDKYKLFLQEAITEASQQEKSLQDPQQRELIESKETDFFRILLPTINQLIKSFQGFFVHEIEKKYENQPTNQAYLINGFIDNILCDGNGENITIIDFKKSSTPKKKDCSYDSESDNPLIDFQMASYIHLYESENKKSCCENALFFSINSASSVFIIKADEKSKDTRESYQSTLDFFEKQCSNYHSDVNNFDLTVKTPYKLTKETCKNCAYNPICRTNYFIRKKNPACTRL